MSVRRPRIVAWPATALVTFGVTASTALLGASGPIASAPAIARTTPVPPAAATAPASGARVAAAPPDADTAPLLSYAASHNFPPVFGPDAQAGFKKRLDRITFDLSKDPPPEANCAQTLGARRFATLFDDLGGVYSNMGDDVRAADAYAKAIGCNPRAEFLHAQLAASLLDLSRYDEARTEIQRELSLGRGNFTLHSLMTQLDFIAHRWPEAERNSRLAVTEAPDDEQATYWQCFLWLAQKHGGAVAPVLADRKLPMTWPTPILESLQGKITEAELVEAVSAERDVSRRRDILSEALFYTGQQRLAVRRSDEAERYFTATVNLKVVYFIEHHLAVAELETLRHPGVGKIPSADTDSQVIRPARSEGSARLTPD